MELIIRRRAAFEIQEAFAHYEAERLGLGWEFFRCVEGACAQALRQPLASSRYYRTARRLYLRRFPFSIFYLEEPDFVSVVALFHSRRDPSAVWSRLEDEGA